MRIETKSIKNEPFDPDATHKGGISD